ncbi:hypothetical protein BGZ94_004594 [Podila epigama]|nr:hypothetical protein BGZ94_004594 [Podila epigama]
MDGFHARKKAILIALNSDTPDKSPKGYVDEPLLPLIVLINNHAEYVTTSSCSGRICTYLEGLDESVSIGQKEEGGEEEEEVRKDNQKEGEKAEEEDVADDDDEPKGYDENTSLAAVEASKRAKGGQWLYVSHDPVVMTGAEAGTGTGTGADKVEGEENDRWIVDLLFGPEAHRVVTLEEQQERSATTGIKTLGMARSQLVYFKFEPMILHIEAATPVAAKQFLNHSLFSGYRNSGILPSAKRTMLAIRSTLKLDAPIAYIPQFLSSSASHPSTTTTAVSEPIYLMVSLTYLRVLVELSNDKFVANVEQMARFEARLKQYLVGDAQNTEGGSSSSFQSKKKTGDQGEWEDKDVRRERKKREGLERAAAAAAERARRAQQEAESESVNSN